MTMTRWENWRSTLISSPAANCCELPSPSGRQTLSSPYILKLCPFVPFLVAPTLMTPSEDLSFDSVSDKEAEMEVDGRMKDTDRWAGKGGVWGARITERVSREGMSPGKKGRTVKGGEDERKEGWKEQDKKKEDGLRTRGAHLSSIPFFQTSQPPF